MTNSMLKMTIPNQIDLFLIGFYRVFVFFYRHTFFLQVIDQSDNNVMSAGVPATGFPPVTLRKVDDQVHEDNLYVSVSTSLQINSGSIVNGRDERMVEGK